METSRQAPGWCGAAADAADYDVDYDVVNYDVDLDVVNYDYPPCA